MGRPVAVQMCLGMLQKYSMYLCENVGNYCLEKKHGCLCQMEETEIYRPYKSLPLTTFRGATFPTMRNGYV